MKVCEEISEQYNYWMHNLHWMTTFSTKLDKRMNELGISAIELSQRVGLTDSAIGHYRHGRRPPPLPNIIKKLEEALELPPGWFMYEEELYRNIKGSTQKSKKNSYHLPLLQPYDVFDWVRYGKLPAHFKEIEVIIVREGLSDKSFLMPVIGDSMKSPNGTGFMEGEYVIVEPNLIPKRKSFVVAKIKNTNDIKIRLYDQDGAKFFLKTFDERYPLIEVNEEVQILGVIVQKTTFFEGGDTISHGA